MPNPKNDETQDEWIDRCMGDAESKRDFPDAAQRLAFCFSRWRQAKRNRTRKALDEVKSTLRNIEGKGG